MPIELPEKFEAILARHSDEDLKVRGHTRESLRKFIEGRIIRDQKSPKIGEIAPDLELELMSPEGKRTGEMVNLSAYRGKPMGLVFGSYT
jgi:hypothetical protein